MGRSPNGEDFPTPGPGRVLPPPGRCGVLQGFSRRSNLRVTGRALGLRSPSSALLHATMPLMAEERISGTLAAAVTPLRDAGERVDEDAFGPLLEFYAASGIDGLFVLGTTGEGVLLADDERRRVAESVVSGAGALRVVVHCGAQTTARTRALAAHAAKVGADAVAVMGPPYFALDANEQLGHFAA